MFYTIYKTTNKLNGKYYIGMHKTNNLEDGYMGSGKLIKRAIQKYGVENFSKEILFVFNNESDMLLKEKQLVVVSEETYNICEGGKGGFSYINRTGKNIYENHGKVAIKTTLEKVNSKRKIDKEYNEKFLSLQKAASKLGVEAQKKKYPEGIWKGRKHKEETILKLKKSKNVGEKNSQFGTCWINDGSKNLKIKKDLLDEYISLGYSKGRINGNMSCNNA